MSVCLSVLGCRVAGNDGTDYEGVLTDDPLGFVRLVNALVRETALTNEASVTVHYVFVNDGPEDVIVRLAEVRPACCVMDDAEGPIVVRAGRAEPYGVRVRVPPHAETMAGNCRFVVAPLDRFRRVSPKSLPARFEVSVLEPVELVGAEADPRVLAAGLCGETVPVEAQLCARVLRNAELREESAAYDLSLVGARGELKVEEFLGCGAVGSRVVEYRWRVRGRVELPTVPGTSPPVDVVVRSGGAEFGRTWLVLQADSRYELEPRSVILKCDSSSGEHPFVVVVRDRDGLGVVVTEVLCTGPVEVSLERSEEGACLVRGAFECREDVQSYAEIELHFESEKQRLVTIPVLHLGVREHSALVREKGATSAR